MIMAVGAVSQTGSGRRLRGWFWFFDAWSGFGAGLWRIGGAGGFWCAAGWLGGGGGASCVGGDGVCGVGDEQQYCCVVEVPGGGGAGEQLCQAPGGEGEGGENRHEAPPLLWRLGEGPGGDGGGDEQ